MSSGKSVFDEPVAQVESGQRGASVRTSDYVQTGHVPVSLAADGGVRIGGGDPPPRALYLSGDNFICLADEERNRPVCEHLVQWVTEADGVVKGMDEQPKQIRRWCTRLATASELMELGEIAIFACSARRPIDVRSEDLIKNFERRQRELAAEHAQKASETDL